MAANKPALNNGFGLFSENPVMRFFQSFGSKDMLILVSLILAERSSVI